MSQKFALNPHKIHYALIFKYKDKFSENWFRNSLERPILQSLKGFQFDNQTRQIALTPDETNKQTNKQACNSKSV